MQRSAGGTWWGGASRVAMVACLAGLVIAGGVVQAQAFELVSRASGPTGPKGNGDSFARASSADTRNISADGRFVVFSSSSTNLTSDGAGADGGGQVYLRDLQANTTVLVSRASGAAGAPANRRAGNPAISADGRRVSFSSDATNLHPDAVEEPDAFNRDQIFVRDLATGTTILASRAPGASGAKGNAPSNASSLSADGRYVAFDSTASNLDPATSGVGPFAETHVYVRDLAAGTTSLVSRASGASGARGNNLSAGPSISANGRRVAFASSASNLDPADADSLSDVYVRDLDAGATILASRAGGASGAKGNGRSQQVSISSDGLRVAFGSTASNLDPADTDTTQDDFSEDVFVRDLAASTTTLASRASGSSGAKASGRAMIPAISANGRTVVFESAAANLYGGITPLGSTDLFARDLAAGTTRLVSLGSASGAPRSGGNGRSSFPSLSADGRYVSFNTTAANLHPDKTDRGVSDILRAELGSASGDPFLTKDADGLALECEFPLTLLDVLNRGRRAFVSGVADPSMAAQRLRVRAHWPGRRRGSRVRNVGTATVRANGRFSALVSRPSTRYQRARVRYFVEGTHEGRAVRAKPLHLERRMDVTRARVRGGRIEIAGRVRPPRARNQRQVRVLIQVQDACRGRRAFRTVARVRISSRMTFRARIPIPADRRAVRVRATTKVATRRGQRAGRNTYTLPRGLNLPG